MWASEPFHQHGLAAEVRAHDDGAGGIVMEVMEIVPLAGARS